MEYFIILYLILMMTAFILNLSRNLMTAELELDGH